MAATPAPERAGTGAEWRGLPVQLDAFAGPLDLLLYLIRREEVSIYDIPIARITEQYLAYIADLADLDLDKAAEYLVMAATLLQIKAKTLLPRPPRPAPEPDETWEGEEDPRLELVRQLEAYALFKEAARELARRESAAQRVWSRGWHPEGPSGPPPLSGVGIDDLVAAFREVLAEEWSWREVPREEIPLREKVRELQFLIGRSPQGVRFHQLFGRGASRVEVIVTFLALLELIRQRKAVAEQGEIFGEIWIRPAPGAAGTPAGAEAAAGTPAGAEAAAGNPAGAEAAAGNPTGPEAPAGTPGGKPEAGDHQEEEAV